MSSADGATFAATMFAPSAAIIAPLSVQYRIGGIRKVIPASAHRSAAISRSCEFAEKPPPMTRVSTSCRWQAASVFAVRTSATASANEAATSLRGSPVLGHGVLLPTAQQRFSARKKKNRLGVFPCPDPWLMREGSEWPEGHLLGQVCRCAVRLGRAARAGGPLCRRLHRRRRPGWIPVPPHRVRCH